MAGQVDRGSLTVSDGRERDEHPSSVLPSGGTSEWERSAFLASEGGLRACERGTTKIVANVRRTVDPPNSSLALLVYPP